MSFQELKDTKLLSEKDIGSTVFRLYEGNIYHVEIRKGEKVSMEIVQQGYDFVDEIGGDFYYNIFEFHSFSDVDPEVREWAASPNYNSYTIADAIVINSFPQKILADFYIKFNKPVKPTKIFNSTEAAYNWVKELMDKKG